MISPVKREPQALQDYQERLNEALADVASDTNAVIALSIDNEGWIVSLSDLAETSICPPLARTGAMPFGVLGVGNFRGNVNTVISMPQLLGLQVADLKGAGWATVLHSRFGIPIALWWPTMLGLFPRADFTKHVGVQLPSVARSSWINRDARVWHELDTERLLRDKLGLGEGMRGANDGE